MNDIGRARLFRGMLRMVLTLVAIGVMPEGTAWAHKLFVFASVQGKAIHGEAYYQDGSPAQNVRIAGLVLDGDTLDTTTTHAEGKFTYHPRSRRAHRFVADAGFGHRAEYTVAAEELPSDLSEGRAADPKPDTGLGSAAPARERGIPDGSPEDLAAEVQALGQQIAAMRGDLVKWQAALRLQDVLGGVGYILGILGVMSYFLAGRRRNRAEPVEDQR